MKINTRQIMVKDQKIIGVEIDLPQAPLVLAKGGKGYLMCGYLDIEIAQKLGQVAAIVKGVKTIDELLNGEVVQATTLALDCGVALGMTGKKALLKMV